MKMGWKAKESLNSRIADRLIGAKILLDEAVKLSRKLVDDEDGYPYKKLKYIQKLLDQEEYHFNLGRTLTR
jgi:hypothetical protein